MVIVMRIGRYGDAHQFFGFCILINTPPATLLGQHRRLSADEILAVLQFERKRRGGGQLLAHRGADRQSHVDFSGIEDDVERVLAHGPHRVRHFEGLADLFCCFGRNFQTLAEQRKLENDGVIQRALSTLAGIFGRNPVRQEWIAQRPRLL